MTKAPKIASPVGRSVKEWIGSSPDAEIPGTVRLRIFRRAEGRCHITGRKIAPGENWQAEHIKPLSEGGEHRESNLAPALVEPHKEKTKEEAGRRAKADAVAKRDAGITKPKGTIPQPPKAPKSTAKLDSIRALGLPRLMRGVEQ